MKKAIVTGATGFIGKHLVRELVTQDVEVIAVIRPRSKNISNIPNGIRIVECDLSEFKKLPEIIIDNDIEILYHVAWQGVSGSDLRNQEIQLQNLKATLDLIDAMNVMGIGTFVGCGSIHEAEAAIEMSQDKIVNNLGLFYKAAKTSAHWMGKAKAGSYGIKFFWPLINTYGEGENSSRLVNTIIKKIYNNESPELSSGNQYYDFVHVEDVAHALYLIAEKGVDGSNYMIGSGNAKQLKYFLEIVGDVANEINGTKIPLGFGKITDNVVSLPVDVFNVEKLKRDTGFVPKISFEEGVKRTASWIREEI